MLESLRTTIPARTRGTAYAAIAALVPALIGWGVLSETVAAAVGGVAAALVTLAFAVVHSTSPIRTAGYGVAAAVTVLFAVLGWGSIDQWELVLAVIAPVLGIGVAAANTPAPELPAPSAGD